MLPNPVFVFGVYLIGMGVTRIAMPNTVCGLFKLPSPNEIRIRVPAVVIVVPAFYDIQASRANLRSIAEWALPARVAVFLFFAGLALLGWVGRIVIVLGSADLPGADRPGSESGIRVAGSRSPAPTSGDIKAADIAYRRLAIGCGTA